MDARQKPFCSSVDPRGTVPQCFYGLLIVITAACSGGGGRSSALTGGAGTPANPPAAGAPSIAGTGAARATAGAPAGGTRANAGNTGGQSGPVPSNGGTSGSASGASAAAKDDAGTTDEDDASTPEVDAAVTPPPPKCDKIPPSSDDCAEPLAPGDARKCAMTVSLNRRSYYLYAPKTYDPCKPTALVIDCHGAMETAEAQAGIDTLHVAQTSNGPLEYPGIGSGWRLEADTPEGGFIVVTPQGINNVWTSLNDDPQFFLNIVAATKKIANIAADKVYMSGISNGSLISFETACANTDVFSGIAAFSAGQNCTQLGKPIPVIAFDAEPDFAYTTTVDATNTMVRLDQCKAPVDSKWLTIDTTTTDNVCRNDPFDQHPTLVPCNTIQKTSVTMAGIEPTVCKRWDQCSGGVAVAFCDVAPSTLHGSANAAVDAHILYGNATSLNMPSIAWRFFKSFWK